MNSRRLPDGEGTTRRTFLTGATLMLSTPGAALSAALQGTGGRSPEREGARIVREREPRNLESPFAALSDFITPTEQFYVRNHFAQPALDPREWRLRVEGAVERPLELSYEELRRMASRTRAALLECAGNNRSYLEPKVRGVQWGLGAVGNAEWAGVPLAAVLERARVRSRAVEVVMEGADRGRAGDLPGEVHFARSLPIEHALKGDVLLAHQMNGADLPPSHGFPVRALVPGWYGVSSVKWLTRLIVTERPFRGFFQAMDYTIWERSLGTPALTPINRLQLKAQIARPVAGEVIPASAPYRVVGAAWTGDGRVSRVEVSVDGGRQWVPAELQGRAVPYAWRLWEYEWRVPADAGRRTLLARAVDDRGRVQPLERDPDRRNYMVTHILPVPVEIRCPRAAAATVQERGCRRRSGPPLHVSPPCQSGRPDLNRRPLVPRSCYWTVAITRW
jgi:DMSO/TMAO reductase YedYZ molybdopterin-dependent catalytic subunit